MDRIVSFSLFFNFSKEKVRLNTRFPITLDLPLIHSILALTSAFRSTPRGDSQVPYI